MNNINNNPNIDQCNQIQVTIRNNLTENKTVSIPKELAANLFRVTRSNAPANKLNSKINIDLSKNNNNNDNDNPPASV